MKDKQIFVTRDLIQTITSPDDGNRTSRQESIEEEVASGVRVCVEMLGSLIRVVDWALSGVGGIEIM